MTLNPFHATGLFQCPPPENIRKPLVFSFISGSIEKDQCHEMG